MKITLPYPPSVAGLYIIRDTVSGRAYYGSTNNLAKRWRMHKWRLSNGSHPNPILQAIWRADSTRLVFFAIAELPNATRDELLREEQRILDYAQAGIDRMCMNILQLAGSPRGRKRSLETRARIARAAIGRKHTAATISKLRAVHSGKILSEQHKKNIGAALRGKTHSRRSGIINKRLRLYSEDDVRAIRALRDTGMSWRILAKHFNSKCVGNIRRIALGLTYMDVKGAP